jgi:hypothetical protein
MARLITYWQAHLQKVVVCKKWEPEMIESTALGQKPRCCLQDLQAGVFRPANAVAGDFVPPALGAPGDNSSSSQGAPRAICADSPSSSVDKPDRRRFSADDNQSGVGFGMRLGCKLFVADDNGWAETLGHSTGNGDPSSGNSE